MNPDEPKTAEVEITTLSPPWMMPTNQTQKPVLTFDTTLKYAEVLLSWSSVKMPDLEWPTLSVHAWLLLPRQPSCMHWGMPCHALALLAMPEPSYLPSASEVLHLVLWGYWEVG